MRQLLPVIAFVIAAAAMLAILLNGFELAPELEIPFSLASIFVIGLFSVIGLFDRSILRYAYYSAIIQFGYFALDVSTALLINKSVWFAVLQFINFIVAGSVFAIIISLFYNAVRKAGVRDYAGIYDKNQFLGIALAVSCLSLGGMPGFNIFVGEFIIYSSLFTIHPALTIAAIFASLLCFIFYFRICYVMFAGTVKTVVKTTLLSRAVISILTLAIIFLGLIPQILLKILEWYT